MSIEKFINLLKHFRGILNKQQIKTLRGQALSGDLSGALKGLERISDDLLSVDKKVELEISDIESLLK